MGKKKDMFCIDCHHQGELKIHTKGYFLIELVLWICFIVPGLIYTIWRVSSRQKMCVECGGVNLIPVDSPRARQLLEQKY